MMIFIIFAKIIDCEYTLEPPWFSCVFVMCMVNTYVHIASKIAPGV